MNDNMPFDEFTVEQLAGDLQPHPTQEQKVATAFNRNQLLNGEGGAHFIFCGSEVSYSAYKQLHVCLIDIYL